MNTEMGLKKEKFGSQTGKKYSIKKTGAEKIRQKVNFVAICINPSLT
jgi:hypothetical protein